MLGPLEIKQVFGVLMHYRTDKCCYNYKSRFLLSVVSIQTCLDSRHPYNYYELWIITSQALHELPVFTLDVLPPNDLPRA